MIKFKYLPKIVFERLKMISKKKKANKIKISILILTQKMYSGVLIKIPIWFQLWSEVNSALINKSWYSFTYVSIVYCTTYSHLIHSTICKLFILVFWNNYIYVIVCLFLLILTIYVILLRYYLMIDIKHENFFINMLVSNSNLKIIQKYALYT